jgi:hypothetical protein
MSKPYGSAMIECQTFLPGQPAFIVTARSATGRATAFFCTGDAIADNKEAERLAADLADRVFVSSSVNNYWAEVGRMNGRTA